MIATLFFCSILALCYIYLPFTKIYVLSVAGIAAFFFLFEPLSRWTSALSITGTEASYKPLNDNPESGDYEIVYVAKNTSIRNILFDTLNQNTLLYTNSDEIYKINLAGEVVDKVPALSWEPFSYHTIPILISMDSRSGAAYRNWINTSDSSFKEFKELNSDRSMTYSQWNGIFNELYQKAAVVEYTNLHEGQGVIFKINDEWILLKSFINENGDGDERFHWNGTDITFDDFPVKKNSQLISLTSSIPKGAYKFNYKRGTSYLALEKYKKLNFEWPSCPPGIPLPIAGGLVWSGVGYYDLLHHSQHIKFSLPTEYAYHSLSYDGQVFPYYLPTEYQGKSDIMFLEVAESYSQSSGEDEKHRDGLGFYVVRKKHSKSSNL